MESWGGRYRSEGSQRGEVLTKLTSCLDEPGFWEKKRI